MKVYTKEQISALLEKAASEIEERDAEITRLQKELEDLKKDLTVNTMVKEASFKADESDNDWFGGSSLGEPSSVNEYTQSAKDRLESFLANLS